MKKSGEYSIKATALFIIVLMGLTFCCGNCFAQTGQLPEPALKSGKAVFKCRFLDYDASVVKRLSFVYHNIMENKPTPFSCDIDKNGNAEVEIDIVAPTHIELTSDFIGGNIMLSPGGESTLVVKMKEVIEDRKTKKEGYPDNMENFIFSGANAGINNYLSSDEVAEFLYKDWGGLIDAIRGFLGMSLDDYKKYHIKSGETKIAKLDSLKDAMNLSEQVYEMTKLRIRYQVLEFLIQPDTYLASAIKIAQNEGKKTDYVVPKINIDYFSFLKDYPVNDKVSLYAPEYVAVLAQCKYIIFKLYEDGNVPFNVNEFLYHLEKSDELRPEDVRWVNELKKQDHLLWNKKQIKDYKISRAKYMQDFINTKKLPDAEILNAQNIIKRLNQLQKVEDVRFIDSLLLSFRGDLIDNYIFTSDVVFDIINKNTAESIDPQIDMDTMIAFNDRYNDFRERYNLDWLAIESDKVLEQILGTDRGFLFDLLYVQRLLTQVDRGLLINNEGAEKLSKMEPFYWQYFINRKGTQD